MNLLIGIALYAVVLCGFGLPQSIAAVGAVNECLVPAASQSATCGPDSVVAPAALAGLQAGDRFVSIDGQTITDYPQVISIINSSAGKQLTIVVERGSDTVTLEATPALTERYVTDSSGATVKDAAGNPTIEQVGILGFSFATATVPQPLTAVLPAVGDNVVSVVGIIAHLPQRLVDVWNAAFGSQERDPNGPISVVGVGRLAGEITSLDTLTVAQRAQSLIGVLASLNIALFVFNLIPLMPLDGGHVAAALVDAVRRGFAKLFRRKDPGYLDIARLIPLTMVVVTLLGLMSVLLIYADIVKPISIL
jgi:membrane-associated protease RseP (regulator of RpoE activity)